MEVVDLVTSGISDDDDTFQLDNNYSHDNNSIFEGERCGICMDVIIDRGVLDCCQHWFCFVCIDNWATITNLCPLCQSEFQLITCVPVYDAIGSNKVEEDSFSRDDDWFIEGKSSTLSFPSYYIDEDAVVCLDQDGCKIRTGSATIEGDLSLDTSIACDSCDIWYHALCVGFDPEGTSEDTWLCPRCVDNEVPQKTDGISIQRASNHCGSQNANSRCLVEDTFSGKVSVSIDAGETAVVVSMVDGSQYTEGSSEDFLSTFEVDKDIKMETLNPDSSNLKFETESSERTNILTGLEAQKLNLSLSHDASSSLLSNLLVLGQLKTSSPGKTLNEPSIFDGVRVSPRKSFDESFSTNKLSDKQPSLDLHLGLSVSSFLSVDEVNNDGTEDRMIVDAQQHNPSDESLSKGDEDASKIIGVKRTNADCRLLIPNDNVHMSAEDEETKAKNEPDILAKKIRGDSKIETTPSKDIANPQKCLLLMSASKDDKLQCNPVKQDVTSDILSIVQGSGYRSSKGLASRKSVDKTSKGDNLAGLRVKRIMRRPTEDLESSMVVQELRKKIREAVRNKSSKDIGENLFDPKLLAAFRTVIAGPKSEPVKKLLPSALKVKKSMLQKGKIRENLTRKIYGDSNGKRKRAWDRDCEVEFWKHRSMRATKPEKIETLKSVLDLLRNNSGSTEIEQASESQATNPILSRLYLADTSVFPRKDDIKPLSALKATSNSEQNKEASSVGISLKPSLANCTIKFTESYKIPSKVCVPSPDHRGSETNSSSKDNAASGKVHPDRRPGGSSFSSSGNFKVNFQKEMGAKCDDIKVDKRKWALEVLARKKALEGKTATHEKQEDHAVLKGNYPLLAQLPVDMRPVLAPSRQNKIPVSIRKTQLYRLSEHFLRKAHLPVICRTAETELAVADAINIEKEVADRSNSKLVYLNLCSQEILHHSDNSNSIKATESNSSPSSAVPVNGLEQATDDPSNDPVVVEALRTAGLLSDSPPNSPNHKMEVSSEVDDSSMNLNEEGPDNAFEIGSHLEVDIYGDFECDLENEDFIGATALKVSKLQPEEGVAKVKVLFSTLNSVSSNDALDSESCGRLGEVEVPKDSTSLEKSHADAGIGSSTIESEIENSCVPLESLPGEEGEDLSVTECEELYGPDKEPLINKLPEGASLIASEVPSVKIIPGNNENCVSNHNASGSDKLPNDSQTGDSVPRKEKKSNTDTDKQCDSINSVSKKVEAYIKEHIRPLCKSGVITTEQYRWAVAKTTDKVMKYHLKAKTAKFLIKEGEKVKKLAEQYVEAAQQKEKCDPL
ncbi:PHD domain-containing protein/zf-C3HC4_2 domain-containing protein [Cephalotus follicularis]|uniref:PHD domain-containing protein/zf-C3HC4_2 domain-containing protein n=1 Tax=Cephalotus follicularis TaxID=3775 RepID=A0A1Q3D905_CEPFO|nr:PHD domain-containing protein/zf-C3HC4_2 domain-containing protein [Cephalotus follicularis]